MSDEFDSDRYTQDGAGRVPAEPPAAPRRATLRSSAKRAFADPRAQAALIFLGRHLLLIVIILLILLPIGGVVAGYLARPEPGSAEQAASGLTANPLDGSDKIKPAPGRPFLAKTQAPAPVVMHQPPAATVDQQTASPMQVPTRPLTPAPALPGSTANPPAPASPPAPSANHPYTPMVYSAHHDKTFGEGCSGQLTLDTTGLVFRCPDDPHSSVLVPLGDIESVDGNGVRLTSGKKYHFTIAGMGRNNAQELFANWLSRVR